MRTIGRLILTAVFAVLTIALVSAAAYVPAFFDFYTGFSRDAADFLGRITGSFPFAVWEVLALLLILLLLYTLVRTFRQKRGFLCWLSGVALLASVLVFLFVGLWGLNHYGPSVAERVGLEVTGYTNAQLTETTAYMAAQAGAWAGQVERSEAGDMKTDFAALSKSARLGYEALGETYAFFQTEEPLPRVKRLLAPNIFSYAGITGIFVPFTGESGVNPDTYAASLPFTMCHELAHRLSIAAEDEANFAAFLACTAHSDAVFQYSGWYSAFIYCYNALYEADRAAATEIWDNMSDTLRADCRRANEHYAPYEGAVQDAAQQVNDAYLKAFDEEDGVQSYGKAADLLIAWYLQRD